MKMIIFLFFILILSSSAYPESIGISPSSLEIGKEGKTLHIFNPNGHDVGFIIENDAPDKVRLSEDKGVISAGARKYIEVYAEDDGFSSVLHVRFINPEVEGFGIGSGVDVDVTSPKGLPERFRVNWIVIASLAGFLAAIVIFFTR